MSNERGIGDNGGPPLVERNFKKRWAMALFSAPDKPAGAVAMGFKLYVEMDAQGRGAAVSDAEFMVCCGVSDGSCRNFKRWLVEKGFIQISRRGYRGHRSEFRATIPGDQIAATIAAIGEALQEEIAAPNTGKNIPDERQPLPANPDCLPATIAAIAEPAKKNPPHPLKENNNNNKQLNNYPLSQEAASEREIGTNDLVTVNGVAIHGPNFKLDFAAIDMIAGLAGIDAQRARQIAEICARDWAANNTKPAQPMAMVKAAIMSDFRQGQVQDLRMARAARPNQSQGGISRLKQKFLTANPKSGDQK